MNAEEIKKQRFIRFIKSNNPFYAFTSFDGHSIEQLDKIKKDIEQVIKSVAKKNRQKKNK